MKRIVTVIVMLTVMLSVFASCNNVADKTENDTKNSDIPSEALSESPTRGPEASQRDENEMFGTYFRANDNSPLAFSISISPDGTYQYYETVISSHLGHGRYTVDGNVITLIDEGISSLEEGGKTYFFKFEYKDGKLIYLAAESDNFLYVKLPDGAEFEKAPQAKQ